MIYLGIAVGLCLLDFVLKGLINRKVGSNSDGREGEVCEVQLETEQHKCIEILPLYNKGAAMGFLQGHKKLLNIITVIAVTMLSVCFGIALKTGTMLERFGYALVNAGAWNNAYERIVKGTVTDYINFPKFPGRIKDIVFNISDFFIMIGAFLLIIVELCKKR